MNLSNIRKINLSRIGSCKITQPQRILQGIYKHKDENKPIVANKIANIKSRQEIII